MIKLFSTIMLPLFALNVSAQSVELCVVPTNEFDSSVLTKDNKVSVSALNAQLIQNQTALFNGNVEIISPDAIINADIARIDNNGRQVTASGDVLYRDNDLQVESQGVEVNTDLKLLQMQDTEYQFKDIAGRGSADLLSLSGEQGLRLEEVTFTTCPKGGEDWRMSASEIVIEKDSPFGEAYNTKFYLGGVPVFWLPYFAFPVTAERQSGLLFPNIGSSSQTGVEYEQPVYWNIAPNYDATISPRLMTNRGLQLKTEFRYLFSQNQGELQLEYLPNDIDTAETDERYFYRYLHQGKISDNWNLNVDFSGISDDNYIVDLGSDYYNRADTHLYRQMGLSYYSNNLDFSLQFRDFEVIGDHPDVYRALPEMKLNYEANLGEFIDFNLSTEAAYFENNLDTLPNAFRVHIEPSLSIPYQRAWGELLAEVSALQTYYEQDLVDNYVGPLTESVSRTIGQGRLYGSLIFENTELFEKSEYLLTFEPKAQYLYTSFEEQSEIGFYDTTPLLTTFNNLFRGQEFTGLDRINDNNQFTLGATARLIDQQNREKLVLSIGQIFYLQESKLISSVRDNNRSALAAELDWQVNQRWFLHSDIQVATETQKVERSSIATEYRIDDNKLIQMNHRFIRDLSGEEINQFGISASWPLTKNWHWVGRWYRDAELSRTTESFMGLQYESCCWAIRMTYQRNLSNRFDDTGLRSTNEFDSGIAMQFIIKGIGSRKRNSDILEQGMFGYRQPYVLN
ncbi:MULTISPECIES: LPS assembly protein LptD [Alteromonadaceae]|jgi:LPS-assembly protein|uniref:LPS-assembly protein LptD n=1 Tax=Brumicola blandensis TaxID=3075611 RepID=A0AAW8R772_9ALTE|nr:MULTISPECIES: LPS assembly protein LptD [unclassified Alteromonas]MDT0584324.1 LPS assembly protein LptD [Alteromonas sp. W409]MDT0629768.1 LPS assembly protein LptD [Alteromonas sp. W364]